MFFTVCSPRSEKLIGTLLSTCSRTELEMQMPPGSARVRPHRYVDAIAVDIVALDDNIADIDADAKNDPPVFWFRGVACPQPS